MLETGLIDQIVDQGVAIVVKFFSPSTRIFWLYLLTAALMATLVYYIRVRDDSKQGLMAYLLPKRVWLHRSAINDYIYVALTLPLWTAVVTPTLISSVQVGESFGALLGRFVGEAPQLGHSPTVVAVVYTVCLLVASDLRRYWVHRLFHRIPIFWEFHKVHHSAEVLTPITLYRSHPVEMLLSALTSAIATGVVTGMFVFFYPNNLSAVTILGVNAGRFLFYFFGANLRHSHVWLSFGRKVEHVLISPAQHQIHHSAETRHFDKNFGSMFALWDWMFGSLYVPKGKEELTFGLGERENRNFGSVWRMYLYPFYSLWRKVVDRP